MPAGSRPSARRQLAVLACLVAACSTNPARSSSLPSVTSPSGTATAAATMHATAAPSPLEASVQLLGPLVETPLDPHTAQRLQAALDGIVANGAPDIMAAVLTAEGTWSGAAGTIGPKASPATPDGVFAVASITKSATATLLLRLAELGKVDLDAPAATYIPDMAEPANGATVRQLLGMRGGQAETPHAVLNQVYADCSHDWTRAEIIGAFPARAAQPGTIFVYSNPSFKLAGFVAEQASGVPLAEAMRTYVTEPAGVTRFVLQTADSPAPTPWALPLASNLGPLKAEDYGAGGALPCLSDATFSAGGVSMAGDAASIAQWAWQLFAGNVISETSLGQMLDIDADDYGLGIWRLHDFGSEVAFGHAGNKPGYSPLYVVFPEREVVIALCINDQDADPYAPARALLAVIAG